MEKLIERINELARKAKTEGLTEEEKGEQRLLREEYLARFRQNFREVLDNTVIMEPDGTKRKVQRKEKKPNNWH